jgi:hypothetical protein
VHAIVPRILKVGAYVAIALIAIVVGTVIVVITPLSGLFCGAYGRHRVADDGTEEILYLRDRMALQRHTVPSTIFDAFGLTTVPRDVYSVVVARWQGCPSTKDQTGDFTEDVVIADVRRITCVPTRGAIWGESMNRAMGVDLLPAPELRYFLAPTEKNVERFDSESELRAELAANKLAYVPPVHPAKCLPSK